MCNGSNLRVIYFFYFLFFYRRTTSQTSESGDERESSKNVSPVSGEDTGKPKKSLFKKKIKKV